MDTSVSIVLTELAANLTSLIVKGTVTSVGTKIKNIKNEKKLEAVKNSYDEIINELLSEREEAIRIAQTYKSEIDRYQISDDDIKHLHATVNRVLEILQQTIPNMNIEGFNQLKELISIDTLKSMQLLGFNYKRAIGEPLTELCAMKISAFGNPTNQKHKKTKNK